MGLEGADTSTARSMLKKSGRVRVWNRCGAASGLRSLVRRSWDEINGQIECGSGTGRVRSGWRRGSRFSSSRSDGPERIWKEERPIGDSRVPAARGEDSGDVVGGDVLGTDQGL
ncbi:hypothetical protein PIB30_043453 [Stylosanthes scabra]|uniref:Uncharacterized protein n=1 Tax=Stylosanthes scabra TaxID=79078 RepID=A0ABU6XDC1_9FABA|nr:hypothetical protein [Stylosanthes scabra]